MPKQQEEVRITLEEAQQIVEQIQELDNLTQSTHWIWSDEKQTVTRTVLDRAIRSASSSKEE